MTAPEPPRALAAGLWIRVRALRAFSFPVTVLPVAVATAAVRSIRAQLFTAAMPFGRRADPCLPATKEQFPFESPPSL